MRLRPGSALVVLFCHALPMAHAVAGDCQAPLWALYRGYDRCDSEPSCNFF